MALPGVTTTYTYDADGNRVKKASGTTTTLYWYMSPGIVAESDTSGALKSEYVFFAGERVARRDLPAASVSYYFSDHLKTASVITDSAGHITDESDYYPWGGELQLANSGTNHYKLSGKERDTETGCDYFGARYYCNSLSRFLTSDWSGTPVLVPYADLFDPQSLNLYRYAKNNPTTFDDPDGHCPQCAAPLLATPPGQVVAALVILGGTAVMIARHPEMAADAVRGLVGMLRNDNSSNVPPPPPPTPSQSGAQSTPATPPGHDQNNQNSNRNNQQNQTQQNQGRAQYENPGHHDPNSPNYIQGKTPLPADARRSIKLRSRTRSELLALVRLISDEMQRGSSIDIRDKMVRYIGMGQSVATKSQNQLSSS